MTQEEAPEKIYAKITHPISDEYTEIIAFEDGDGIEYTRTDAFIEKADMYLKGRLLRYIDLCVRGVGISTEEFIEKFKNYMKGV